MNLSPILGGPSLIKHAMKAVGVDHVGSGHDDVVSRSGGERVDEAAAVRIVGPEENALRMLRDDLNDQMWPGLIGTGLERIGRFQESCKLRVQPETHVDITIGLDFEAIHGATHRDAPIEEVEPTGEVDAGKWRTPLALSRGQAELQEWNLDPVVRRDRKQANGHGQRQQCRYRPPAARR